MYDQGRSLPDSKHKKTTRAVFQWEFSRGGGKYKRIFERLLNINIPETLGKP